MRSGAGWRIGGILLLAVWLSPAGAVVYKCPLPGGKHEYRGVPCDAGEGERWQVVGESADNPAGDTASANSLQGTWCEFGVSASEDGDIDSSAQAEWSFVGEILRYKLKAAAKPGPDIPLRRDGQDFFVSDSLFGGGERAWIVIGRRNGMIVVKGPLGGYYHFRPGGC